MSVEGILVTPLGYTILGACIEKAVNAPVRAATVLEVVDILIDLSDKKDPFAESNQTVYRQLETLKRNGLLAYSGKAGNSKTYYITKEGIAAFEIGVGEPN